MKLSVKKGEDSYNFIVMKTHKERFALAEKLSIEQVVSIEGISRFRAIICTRLKQIKQVVESTKETLRSY